jgi:hypothetical protein
VPPKTVELSKVITESQDKVSIIGTVSEKLKSPLESLLIVVATSKKFMLAPVLFMKSSLILYCVASALLGVGAAG